MTFGQYLSLFTFDKKQNRIVLTRPVYFELDSNSWDFQVNHNPHWSSCNSKCVPCNVCQNKGKCVNCYFKCTCKVDVSNPHVGCKLGFNYDKGLFERLCLQFIQLYCKDNNFLQTEGYSPTCSIPFKTNELIGEFTNSALPKYKLIIMGNASSHSPLYGSTMIGNLFQEKRIQKRILTCKYLIKNPFKKSFSPWWILK